MAMLLQLLVVAAEQIDRALGDVRQEWLGERQPSRERPRVTARRNRRRSTYPAPSLLGSEPRRSRSVSARTWSAMMRASRRTTPGRLAGAASAFSAPTECPARSPRGPPKPSTASTSGAKTSVSKMVDLSWTIIARRSSPIPVSIPGRGSGTSVPSACASNCGNTRFQNSM